MKRLIYSIGLILLVISCKEPKAEIKKDESDPPPRDTTEIIESSEPDSLQTDSIIIND